MLQRVLDVGHAALGLSLLGGCALGLLTLTGPRSPRALRPLILALVGLSGLAAVGAGWLLLPHAQVRAHLPLIGVGLAAAAGFNLLRAWLRLGLAARLQAGDSASASNSSSAARAAGVSARVSVLVGALWAVGGAGFLLSLVLSSFPAAGWATALATAQQALAGCVMGACLAGCSQAGLTADPASRRSAAIPLACALALKAGLVLAVASGQLIPLPDGGWLAQSADWLWRVALSIAAPATLAVVMSIWVSAPPRLLLTLGVGACLSALAGELVGVQLLARLQAPL